MPAMMMFDYGPLLRLLKLYLEHNVVFDSENILVCTSFSPLFVQEEVTFVRMLTLLSSFLLNYIGPLLQCQYTLTTFGIPQTVLPLDMGSFALDNTQWFHLMGEQRKFEEQRRAENEAWDNQLGRIDVPTSQDVLLGRGRPFQLYSGNQKLAVLIDTNKERHDRSRKHGGKGAICDEVIQIVKESGGRFLKRNADGDGWDEVDHKATRDKVGHGYVLVSFSICMFRNIASHLELFV
jgi:hypothetical protein